MTNGTSGPPTVTCPECHDEFGSLSALRQHFDYHHPGMSQRERSVLREAARQGAGWWGVRP
jgi:hypothetical protein